MDGKPMENPIRMDDFGGTTIFGNIQIGIGVKIKNTFETDLAIRTQQLECLKGSPNCL